MELHLRRYFWGLGGGAVVGIIGNAFNGNFFSSYFPFGVVNVVGALAWGYYVRAMGLRPLLSGNTPFQLLKFVKAFVVLAIIGGIVCGIASSLVKLALYPPVGDSVYFVPVDSAIYHILIQSFSPFVSGVLSLLSLDIYRDLIDKGIVVFCAMIFAYTVSFVQILKQKIYMDY